MNRKLRLAAPDIWRTRGLTARLLLPLSWIYLGIVGARRACYRSGILRVVRFPKPVVVVGGITVGGSGKTPLVIHVVRLLAEHGYKPGVVSRGYRGSPGRAPLVVDESMPARECGDEPALLARNLKVPIVVDANRPRGVTVLISELGCDVVISDDGMQHYAMDRKVEIAVIGGHGFEGNGYCLPAGPLREPLSRLAEVDIIVHNGAASRTDSFAMHARIEVLKRLDGEEARPVGEFRGERMHAVAGIGDPEGFFSMLRDSGLNLEAHVFPDHHPFNYEDFAGMRDAPIVMTEKDAVKCAGMPLEKAWYAPLSTCVDERFDEKLIEMLKL